MKQLLAIALLSTALYACNNNDKTPKADILAPNIDSTVKPGEDFFAYANGTWLKNNPIPEDRGGWGLGAVVLEENTKRLKEINEKAVKANGEKGSNEQKIGDFWSTGMDSVAIEKNGLTPVQTYLDKINAITDVRSLLLTTAELKKIGSSTLFADFVTQDDKNSEMMTYKLWQGGLGLPEREYYFKDDSATKNIRAAYIKYITNTLVMSGEEAVTAGKEANDIIALETKLAQASRKIEDLRDPNANYNKMAITDLPKMAPDMDWKAYLDLKGVKGIDSLIVGQPEFFKALNDALKSTPINTWKTVLKFNLIADFAGALPERFGQESFNFNKLFTGAKARLPRWKRVIQAEESTIGELLDQLYVKEYFDDKAKKRYSDLVEAFREALHDRISKLTWMSDSTKQKAFAKLAAMKKKVGYPDKWKDYSALRIGKESFAANMIAGNTWFHNYNMSKLGKPVNRDDWDMLPHEWNAYYNGSMNEIVLPAGVFTVPGYKDEEVDDAIVYAYGGASTIGHEITHGFDDEGRQYDANGNLSGWWSKKDEEEFNKRAAFIIRQFNEYEPLPGYHINGKSTTGENIADLGGILLAIDAFKKTEQYKKGEKIAGFTPMERFFLGYAYGWMGQIRDEQLRNRLLSDVHSPAKYRVNGPFVDVDEFYTTFGIKPGDKMFRPDSLRVRIW